MAASKFQQIGIWTIAITLTVGTIGSFAAIILANDNAKIDEAIQQEEYAKFMEEQEKQMLEQSRLNAERSEPLEGYSASQFDAGAVTELSVVVISEGSGPEVGSTDSIRASYFGWLSDGTIFDSSKKKEAEDSPVTFPLSGVIAGWTEGLAGQKVGSVVELTIPAAKAYGPTGSGVIPANAPLKFIVIIQALNPEESV